MEVKLTFEQKVIPMCPEAPLNLAYGSVVFTEGRDRGISQWKFMSPKNGQIPNTHSCYSKPQTNADILAGWCSKNNIRHLQEHMNIDKETLEDLDADYNVNEDF